MNNKKKIKIFGYEHNITSRGKKEEVLDNLRKRFLERSNQKLEKIDETLRLSSPDYQSVYRNIHSIVGTAGTLGYKNLSDAAGEIIKYIDSAKEGISYKKIRELFNNLREKTQRSMR